MIIVKDYHLHKYIERDTAITALLAATAARPMEALGWMWDDMKDISGNYSVIYRDTKNGYDRKIPIVREDIWQMLQMLPRVSKYVFPSDTNKEIHMGNQQLGVMEVIKKVKPL